MNGPVYAQTIVGLRRQLHRLGWDDADIRRVDDAYEIGMRLFTAQFRPTGEPFLAHLVRTASILAEVGADPTLVVAGLLHSAYTHGEFGDGRRWPSEPKRAEVRSAVGRESERLVHRYADFAWREALAARARIDALSPDDRAVLLLRLANELEQRLEVAAPGASECLRQGAEAASHLGHPRLATALESAETDCAGGVVAQDGRRIRTGGFYYAGPTASFLLPPRSYRLRPIVALRDRLRRFTLVRTLWRAIGNVRTSKSER